MRVHGAGTYNIILEKYSVRVRMVWLIHAHHFIVLSSKIRVNIFKLFKKCIET
jgi:hypothetical protein